MNTSLAAACLLGLAAILTAAPAAAAPASSLDTLIAACHPGRDHAANPTEGATPSELEGARIVSAGEAHCLMGKLRKELTIIAPLGDERKLPGALAMPWAAESGSAAATRLKETLALMGKGKAGDPLLIYCHHASCGYSHTAARHAVAAGYRNVFWFRDGMRGWAADGYAFAGEEGKDPAALFERRMAACSRKVKSNQDMIDIMASYKPAEFNARYPASVKALRDEVRDCMRAVDADYGADKARKAEVARESARLDGAIEKLVPSLRAALDADARVYLAPIFEKVPVDKIDAYVGRARGLKSVAAACPPPSYDLPRTAAQAASIRSNLEAYAKCMNTLKDGSLAEAYSAEAIEGVINLVNFAEPYVCGKSRSQNCLPEATWRKVAGAVGPDKLRILAQGETKRGEMLKEMLAAQTRLNGYTPTFVEYEAMLDRAEQASNSRDDEDEEEEEEEEEEQPRRQSSNNDNSGGYYYSPPPPPQAPLRQQSNVSAAGIR